MRILFVHGWGYGAQTWDAVLKHLPADIDCALTDFGFAGPESLPEPGYYDIVVGHSMGVLWLLSQGQITWGKLVSICGFTKFTADESFPEGVSSRVVDRMLRKLPLSPEGVLKAFHDLCDPKGQISFTSPHNPNQERLIWGLAYLRDRDARADYQPENVFVLADKSDQVVSEEMSKILFAANDITWLDGKGHLVPQTAPEACCRIIERAVASL